MTRRLLSLFASAALLLSQKPGPMPGGYHLPNGWRITPVGPAVTTEDMTLQLLPSPDGKTIVGLHAGFNPHGIDVVDVASWEAVQRIPLKSAWFGLGFSPDGKTLYASGGNADSRQNPERAPIYAFRFANGKLSPQAVQRFEESIPLNKILWAGLVHHPTNGKLYAANRGTGNEPGHLVIFDSASGKLLKRIQTQINPYDVVLSPDGKTLYVSNWASASVSVIDVAAEKVIRTIDVDTNPNDLLLASDGRLFVSCANKNSVMVIDTARLRPTERINVGITALAPEGSTPNALAFDDANKMLFVANADNNAVAVINVKEPGESAILGYIPAGWYPSALAYLPATNQLIVGNAKGLGGYPNVTGPTSPLRKAGMPEDSVRSLQKGSLHRVDLKNLKNELGKYTAQVLANIPYRDEQLTRAAAPKEPSIVPAEVGVGSPIEHIVYIIKENRTYDQVFGDLKQGNGDPRLTIFGREVTPNHHKLAGEFVLFDNLFCDGEVSVDGHSWSNAAYATDFNEKLWPITYGGHSKSGISNAYVPSAGNLWDVAKAKGLTYRSYGEYATRSSDGTTMEAAPGVGNLYGHVSPKFKLPGMRDTANAKVFLEELDEFERHFASADPAKRLPNYSVMSLGEDHTQGTRPGAPTPQAAVASNDYALGMMVDRLTRSPYWPKTAIFVIEDDAQNGPDHVDARRTVALLISPYTKRKTVDSTLYTTSSLLRTMELLLGLPPMSQYDAAATPMYAALGTKADLAPYTLEKPRIDLNALNSPLAWGAKESMEMNLEEYDKAPMLALNEILWKSVRGADSEMPLPIARFHFRK
jgi:YVTN family beta-propeller protein